MAPFTDNQILDLVGDITSYLGAPGPNAAAGTSIRAGGVQHPFQPLLAVLTVSGGVGSIVVGGSGQRCMLPASDGTPNPCTQITAPPPFTVPTNGSGPGVRIDLIVGEANYSGGLLDASFSYVTGIPGDGVPTFTGSATPVVQIVIQPGAAFPQPGDVQVILPTPTYTSIPAPSSGQLGGGIPIQAAVVTAAPFNAPYLVGNAQTRVRPNADSMDAINNILAFLGPGAAALPERTVRR